MATKNQIQSLIGSICRLSSAMEKYIVAAELLFERDEDRQKALDGCHNYKFIKEAREEEEENNMLNEMLEAYIIGTADGPS